MFRSVFKVWLSLSLLTLLCLPVSHAIAAGPPNTLTYTGQLLLAGSPVNGTYDFQFTLYKSLTGGSPFGSTVTVTSVPVAAGVYYAEINFGSTITAQPFYLETAYRTAGIGNYVTLAPRHLVPMSMFANYAIQSGLSTNTKEIQGKLVNPSAPTLGQVLMYDGTQWSPTALTPAPTYSAGKGLSLSGTTFSVASGGITSDLIGAGAVTSGTIASGAVTSPAIAIGAVTTATIANGAVGTSQIADSSVNGAKLTSDKTSLYQVTGGAAYINDNNDLFANALILGGSIVAMDGNFGGSVYAISESHFSSGTYVDPAVGTAAGLKVSQGLAADTVLTQSLQITGGSDLAEPYKISAAKHVDPRPGMIVCIDPQQLGQMRVSTHAYDTTVGGIISGAKGIQPGITLRQTGSVADGTLPIASIGRVWCWCDADANGAISPGDLLTTSDTPGHAMRVGDYDKAHGAIIGKAMSSLKTGKGLVLVLVTLQ